MNGLPLDGIKQERVLLSEVKGRANFVYNTSNMKPKQLREKIVKEFASEADTIFTVNIMSFGFKHGMPIDADLVFDVRFLKTHTMWRSYVQKRVFKQRYLLMC